MSEKMNGAWIKLDEGNEDFNHETYRMKVPTGWIILTKYFSYHGVSIHQIHIDDPHHLWKLEK